MDAIGKDEAYDAGKTTEPSALANSSFHPLIINNKFAQLGSLVDHIYALHSDIPSFSSQATLIHFDNPDLLTSTIALFVQRPFNDVVDIMLPDKAICHARSHLMAHTIYPNILILDNLKDKIISLIWNAEAHYQKSQPVIYLMPSKEYLVELEKLYQTIAEGPSDAEHDARKAIAVIDHTLYKVEGNQAESRSLTDSKAMRARVQAVWTEAMSISSPATRNNERFRDLLTNIKRLIGYRGTKEARALLERVLGLREAFLNASPLTFPSLDTGDNAEDQEEFKTAATTDQGNEQSDGEIYHKKLEKMFADVDSTWHSLINSYSISNGYGAVREHDKKRCVETAEHKARAARYSGIFKEVNDMWEGLLTKTAWQDYGWPVNSILTRQRPWSRGKMTRAELHQAALKRLA